MQIDTRNERHSKIGENDAKTAMLHDGPFARQIAVQSATAVAQLWDGNKTFWRSTEHREREEGSATRLPIFPTVTLRCTEALIDISILYPEWLSEETNSVLRSCIPVVLSHSLSDMHSTLDTDNVPGVQNSFTTSLYVCTLSKILGLNDLSITTPASALSNLSSAISLFERERQMYGTQLNPFIQFHILRAVLAAISILKKTSDVSALRELVRKITLDFRADIEKLLAQHVLGKLAPSDAVALVFCAASLAMVGREEDIQYVLAALDVGFEAQDDKGCWPLGRVVRIDKDIEKAHIEISTYEIAWAASKALLALAKRKRRILLSDKAARAVKRLVLAGKYVQKSLIELATERNPKRGWCSDHPYGKPLIESWTSANVLQEAVSLYSLIEWANREAILETFVTVDQRDENWPTWLRWESYKKESEPEDKYPILEYLDEKIVKPIKSTPRDLPSADDESVSVLLFGPPGTSKTTIVKAIANGLDWPVVMLSPGDFIHEGLEYIEAQARSVFDRLQMLSHAIVLFDECDELFRNRIPSEEVEQMRGITAFVTASMLPKLQELHDRGRVVFFICTNKFETLDPAIKRGGRIDHIIGVGPPQREARSRIIIGELKGIEDGEIREAVKDELTTLTDGFTRSEIKRTCKLLLKERRWSNREDATRAARTVAERLKISLTISFEEYSNFKGLKQTVSRPVSEGETRNAQ